jgi:hypothetical protein
MKMNDLDALQDLIDMVDATQQQQQPSDTTSTSSSSSRRVEAILKTHLPPDRLRGKRIGGVDATDLGTEAILYMRQFMRLKQLPETSRILLLRNLTRKLATR